VAAGEGDVTEVQVAGPALMEDPLKQLGLQRMVALHEVLRIPTVALGALEGVEDSSVDLRACLVHGLHGVESTLLVELRVAWGRLDWV